MTGNGYEPCPEELWKISFSIDTDGNPAVTAIDPYLEPVDNQNLNAWVSQIQQEYEGISQSNMAIDFADLLKGSLGEASSSTITLDDANGYGWQQTGGRSQLTLIFEYSVTPIFDFP